MTRMRRAIDSNVPVPGLVPGTHAFNCAEAKTWMAGINPATGDHLFYG